ncbi:MAG TPA: hypothetical protein VG388_08485, partial [Solirubrobacteraceae bacterium]|nr:hypothetical protein [Solirubrobacteraceae bacterium]
VALAAWLSLAGQTGAALVVVLAGLVPTVLGPCKPSAWPLAAPAPALGAIGLAGAWPALAGRARGALTRAALGATGWIWTMLGSELGGVNLYLRPPPPSLPPGSFTPSAGLTVHHVLAPLITSGALAPAVVWAAAAAILPWLVRGRSLAVDLVLASAWAAGLVATTHAVLRTVHGSLAPATVDHAVLGGVAAFMIALAPTAVRTCFAGRPGARVP